MPRTLVHNPPTTTRYHADLNTRGSRLQQLQDSWLKQQLNQGRPAAAALTPEQRDMAQAAQWLKGLGWGDDADAGQSGAS